MTEPEHTPAALTPGGRHRPERAARPRRFWVGIGLLALGLLVVITAGWILVTGLLARAQLNDARADLDRLRADLAAGNLIAAAKDRAALVDHASSAHDLTSGPAWAVVADLPGGGPIESARGIASAVDSLASGPLTELVNVRTSLDPAKLRRPDGSIDLAPISAAAPVVARAGRQLIATRTDVRGLPATTWVGAVDSARRTLLDQIDSIAGTVRDADLATSIVPRMLGATTPQHYFLAFQNDAEARGTGGLPGSFAIATADHGRVRFDRFESDSYLDGVSADVSLGADFDQLYGGARSTSLFVNSNISPNFPYAARIWTEMWQRKTGQRLDGALALDPQALAYLLQVTGPATLPGGTQVTAGNVVSSTESDLYREYGTNDAARRAHLVAIAKAVSARVVTVSGSPTSLLDAARQAADQRRLLVWSADPGLETTLERTPVSGALPTTSAPFVGPVVVNDDGTKLDYYLQRATTWTRTGCGATRTVTATVRLTNSAPAGLPVSVTRRSDKPTYRVAPGDHRVELSWFGTAGGVLDSATLDGRAVGATAGRELGHPVFTVDAEIPRGATRVVVLHLSEPAGSGPPGVLNQPGAVPATINVDDARCS